MDGPDGNGNELKSLQRAVNALSERTVRVEEGQRRIEDRLENLSDKMEQTIEFGDRAIHHTIDLIKYQLAQTDGQLKLLSEQVVKQSDSTATSLKQMDTDFEQRISQSEARAQKTWEEFMSNHFGPLRKQVESNTFWRNRVTWIAIGASIGGGGLGGWLVATLTRAHG